MNIVKTYLLGSLFFTLSPSPSVRAETFTTIDFPEAGVTDTRLYGINDLGQAVGLYTDQALVTHGFSYDSNSGEFSTAIDYPGASFTSGGGISNAGDIVGRAVVAGVSHGFILRGTDFEQIDFPGSIFSGSFSINLNGDNIVGAHDTPDHVRHGFLLTVPDGSFSSHDFPDSTLTSAFGVNDSGQIVGRYISTDTKPHGYVLSNGLFQTIDVPGAVATFARSITRWGQIVGGYDSAPGVTHGYFRTRCGQFSFIDVPGATSTQALGINANYVIVGLYDESSGTGTLTHGFILAP